MENRMTADEFWEKISEGAEVFDYCGECHTEIFEGDEYYEFDDNVICDDCMIDFVRKNHRKTA